MSAHTCALTDDGQLYAWGRGNEGQLGLGDYRPRTVPALVKALGEQSAGTSVLQVACGAAHTIALCDNGDVYTWGRGGFGRLGHGDVRSLKAPRLVRGGLAGVVCAQVACGFAYTAAVSHRALNA